jgi:N-acetyl-gamma-glutamyl-phosphate reductase
VLPLAASGLLRYDVEVTAITGSTGAGVKPGATTHFSWRNNNVSVYKAFEHQHLIEIGMNVRKLQPGFGGKVNFIPVRGDFARGILASVHTGCDLTQDEASALYRDFYKDAVFTHVFPGNVDLKQVVNTNKCLLSVEKHGDSLMVNSVIDNLLKGASGQAVQNMNLMFSLPEDTGLRLKASAF